MLLTLTLLIATVNGLILNTNMIQKYPGITRYPWNQMVNYSQNGAIIPFIQSTDATLNAEIPVARADVTPEIYQIPAASRKARATAEQPNIIAIMSESFCDFNNIKPIVTSEPVTPFYDELLKSPLYAAWQPAGLHFWRRYLQHRV